MAKNPASKSSAKKKKTAAAKKDEEKKTKTSKKGKAKSKSAAKATSSVKGKAAAKPKTAAAKKAPAKKAASKPVTIRELLARKFAPLETRAPVKATAAEIPADRFTAPPFFEAANKAEAERIREVLSRKFDYDAIKAAAEKAAAKKPAPAKKAASKPVTIRELLARKFAPLETRAPVKATAAEIPADRFTAPPFFEAANKAEAERIREVLSRKFDYDAIKAAAEKAAAEKAAAEKAAAEKAAAEKAAAEKAAAEKAAAEKAAAEKVAAEKAAAEKVAARKAAAEKEPKVEVTYNTPPETKGSEPMGKTVKVAAAGFAFVLLLIIGASMANSGKYYLKTTDGALEIWKGNFAPIGEGCLLTLPGVTAPEPIKSLYAKKEVFPLASQFYMDRADALLATGAVPDFETIQADLQKAKQYAVTEDLKTQVATRLTAIELMTLLYRADVAAGKGTLEGLEAAAGYLEEAARLDLDEAQAALVERRLEAVTTQPPQMTPLTAPEAQPEAAAETEVAAEAPAVTEAEPEAAAPEAEVAEAPETEAAAAH